MNFGIRKFAEVEKLGGKLPLWPKNFCDSPGEKNFGVLQLYL